MSVLGCEKLHFVSALGNSFNFCTAPGKNPSVGPPATLLRGAPQGSAEFLSKAE